MENVTDLVKDLQDMRDSGHLSDALLRRAVRRLKDVNDRFDWVGVYLLDEPNSELWLHNYMGKGTEHAKIPVGSGVCGTAIETASNQRVDDVSEVENYIACDPMVKSEMVVLIRAGDELFGQIDIDSRTGAAFTDADEAAVQMVADKLAEQIAHERR